MKNYWQLWAWFRYDNSKKQSNCSRKTVASPEEIGVDAVTASVVSKLESISSLKEEQRMALKAFLDGKCVFALLPSGFSSLTTSYGSLI